jgi:diaminopimelate epimerase
MISQFWKYQGTGNDFVMLDNRSGELTFSKEQVIRICDRKFGIGSDGLILIEKSDSSDFYMNFFNPDASQSFCGNGSRCAVRFAQVLGMIGIKGSFEAIDGLHEFASTENEIRIRMRDVNGMESTDEEDILNTGSPHFIKYVKSLNDLDLVAEAKKIRYNDRFKAQGINVNFVMDL